MSPKYEIPEYLLVVDPGKTTGIALVHTVGGVSDIVWSAELDWMDSCNLINKTALQYGSRLRILCETFVITPMTAKNSAAPWSLEMIGVIRYLAAAYGVEQLVFQTPQKAKNFCPNPRLKDVGFWHRGGGGHARDALRHAVTHLVDCGWHHEKLLQK